MHVLANAARVLPRSGLLDLRHAGSMISAIRAWDRTPAACIVAHARSHSDRPFVIDELGMLTFGELEARTNAIAHGLAQMGVRGGERVGVMCRNHRGFVEALLATSKLGATALLLNTDFGGSQLAGVLEREAPRVLIHDSEFTVLLGHVRQEIPRVVAWYEGEPEHETLERLIATGSMEAPMPPFAPGRTIILSAGTTGAPKGVQRAGSTPFHPLLSLLGRIPLRAGETQVICAPMFHGWGFLHLGVGLLLGTPIVLRRRFDPEQALASIAEHRASSAALVPVMLQRIMQLDAHVRASYDLESLSTIQLGGSAIPAGLAVHAMDELGDVVYNVYGSTEVALATAATPRDLREAPGTAGTPLAGTSVKILDGDGREQPTGQRGIVYVGSALASEGYTGGGAKRTTAGMLSSGDIGHIDRDGRLFIDGREDDMIISGGENVYPSEVEELLHSHPEILEAAVVGVEDEQFGQRLRAYVVCRPGMSMTGEDVRAHVKAHLARYKVPRDVELVSCLPRNPAGKVLKHQLAPLGT